MRKKLTLVLFFLLVPSLSFAQGMVMDRFCDIYGDSPANRIEKIIRIFRLELRSGEQLTGSIDCPNGEVFKLSNACIGLYRVATISVANDKTLPHLQNATKLISLYTRKNGRVELQKCQESTEESSE